MKPLYITSLVSALMSLMAVLALSAMTIVPRLGSETLRGQMMLVVLVFFVGWLGLAFCVRPGQNRTLPPQWLGRLLILLGIVYVSGLLLFVIG